MCLFCAKSQVPSCCPPSLWQCGEAMTARFIIKFSILYALLWASSIGRCLHDIGAGGRLWAQTIAFRTIGFVEHRATRDGGRAWVALWLKSRSFCRNYIIELFLIQVFLVLVIVVDRNCVIVAIRGDRTFGTLISLIIRKIGKLVFTLTLTARRDILIGCRRADAGARVDHEPITTQSLVGERCKQTRWVRENRLRWDGRWWRCSSFAIWIIYFVNLINLIGKSQITITFQKFYDEWV